MNHQPVEGFSKLSKQGKIDWIVNEYLEGNREYETVLKQYWNDNPDLQKLHEEFSENTISNFYMPYGIAPNFLIDGKLLALPMAVEESSVVAAASKAAKFWLDKGVSLHYTCTVCKFEFCASCKCQISDKEKVVI
jgi:hydroxymethylglutaryl-CoA reductase